MILQGLNLVLSALESMFYHFRGIYFSLGFDIVAFIIVSYGILSALRLLTNGSFSLSKTVDIPSNSSVRSSSGWSSQGDTDDDISKS